MAGGARLRRGDLLPAMVATPPGPQARRLSRRLRRVEAPGINTLPGGRPTVLWQEARGANVLDVDGNRYLDLTSGFGVAAIGHRHPRVVAAVRRQAGRLLHGLGDAAAHPLRLELAVRLRRLAPLDDALVYFAVSGADAVEVALKTAVLATGRPGVLVFEPAYHGLTLGALAATSRPAFRRPFQAHLHAHLHRLRHGCDPHEVAASLAAAPEIGVALVEPIVGREGVLLPPPGWLADLADLCRDRGVLLAVDEILTGGGRTGRWFAVEHEAVTPDLLCCGKALAGGLPIGVVLGRRALLDAWATPGEALHTGTFVAHPLACAAALATLDVLGEGRLPQRAARLGTALGRRLATWPARFPAVRETRGRGLLWGVELASRGAAESFVAGARRLGVLLLAGGAAGRVAQLLPPLTITERQLAAACDRLEAALAELADEGGR